MYNETDFNLEAPVQEPDRQYYYIAKCRELVQDMEQKKGRRLGACVNTFGCQMNTEHEIEKAA